MKTFKRIKKLYHYLNLVFSKHFGWFFTNGQKAGADLEWMSR